METIREIRRIRQLRKFKRQFQFRLLPNGKTYSQSDTIDKIVYGVNPVVFQGADAMILEERYSIENGSSVLSTSQDLENSRVHNLPDVLR